MNGCVKKDATFMQDMIDEIDKMKVASSSSEEEEDEEEEEDVGSPSPSASSEPPATPTSRPPRPPTRSPGPPRCPAWYDEVARAIRPAVGSERDEVGRSGLLPWLEADVAFDTHCHLDRLFRGRAEGRRRERSGGGGDDDNDDDLWIDNFECFVSAHQEELRPLEGCITIFCNPRDFCKSVRV